MVQILSDDLVSINYGWVFRRNVDGRPSRHQVATDTSCYPRSCRLDGIPGKESVAGGGCLHLCVAKKLEQSSAGRAGSRRGAGNGESDGSPALLCPGTG